MGLRSCKRQAYQRIPQPDHDVGRDGATFIPVDFALVSGKKNMINDIDDDNDRRAISYKRRAEAKKKKTDIVVEMVERAMKHGIQADYVLMDT